MLSDFINYLMENCSATITELSETGGLDHCQKVPGRRFIEDEFRMIDVDLLACRLPGNNLSSVDGLYVKEKDGQKTFYLIEFKKMDLDNPQNIRNSYYFLDRHRTLCKQDCKFSELYENSRENLRDRNQVNLELKPLNTLMLIHRLYIQYVAYKQTEQPYEYHFWNVYTEDFGAYTGEVSACQAKSVGVKYVLIGHSERRRIFNESDDIVNLKLKKSLENNLKVILCVGENLGEDYKEVLHRQISLGLKGIEDEVIIAYEPVYSVGTGIIPSSDEITEVISYIKSLFNYDVKVLYGGSVNLKTMETLKKVDGVSGYLVGTAATDIEEFMKIGEVLG